jgi:hypothetical protein
LVTGAVILGVLAIVLLQRNKQLAEFNDRLLLQNDSVLSVNLQLQKDINFLKHDLDSLVRTFPEKQQLTAGKFASIK